jgi:hypothetical protein
VSAYTLVSGGTIQETVKLMVEVYRINDGYCIPQLKNVLGSQCNRYRVDPFPPSFTSDGTSYTLYWGVDMFSASTVVGVVFLTQKCGNLFIDVRDSVEDRRDVQQLIKR